MTRNVILRILTRPVSIRFGVLYVPCVMYVLLLRHDIFHRRNANDICRRTNVLDTVIRYITEGRRGTRIHTGIATGPGYSVWQILHRNLKATFPLVYPTIQVWVTSIRSYPYYVTARSRGNVPIPIVRSNSER
jgi:hypothetical protein